MKADWKRYPSTPADRTDWIVRHAPWFDDLHFEAVKVQHAGKLYTFEATTRPLSYAGVWFGASYNTARAVLRALGLQPLTPRMADAYWLQATIRIEPVPQPPVGGSGTAYDKHSRELRRRLGPAPLTRIAADLGKLWTPRPRRLFGATAQCFGTYGWRLSGDLQRWRGIALSRSLSPTGFPRLIQAWNNTAHSAVYEDYSQKVVGARPYVTIEPLEGPENCNELRHETHELAGVLCSPEHAGALSYDGPFSEWPPTHTHGSDK